MAKRVSDEHNQHLKEEYGSLASIRSTKTAIFGAERPNSIGEYIFHSMSRSSDLVKTTEFDNGLDISDYDSIIMCNGLCDFSWIENISEEKVRAIFDANVLFQMRVTREFVNKTIKKPYRKKILYIGSMASRTPLNASAAYCSAKAALEMYSRCAAFELTPKGFDVFCLNLSSVIDTSMTDDTIKGLMEYRGISRDEAEDYWSTGNIRPEFLNKKNIADVISFILSGNANWLSGNALLFSGGNR